MPSPTIATFLPASCSFLTSSALSSGNTSLNTLSIPTCLAIALAVRLLSPVIMITSTPRLLSSLTAFILFSLSVSATAIIPASSPSTERYIGVFPSSAKRSDSFSMLDKSIFCSSISLRFPMYISLPSISIRIPCPGIASK